MSPPKKRKSTNPPKETDDLIALARRCVETDRVRYSEHGTERSSERVILQPHVEHVLRNGWWEKRRDRYDPLEGWSYSIRGEDADRRQLRVVVAIVSPDLLVVTCYELEGERRA